MEIQIEMSKIALPVQLLLNKKQQTLTVSDFFLQQSHMCSVCNAEVYTSPPKVQTSTHLTKRAMLE